MSSEWARERDETAMRAGRTVKLYRKLSRQTIYPRKRSCGCEEGVGGWDLLKLLGHVQKIVDTLVLSMLNVLVPGSGELRNKIFPETYPWIFGCRTG